MFNIVFGESSINKMSVCKWHKRFQSGPGEEKDNEVNNNPELFKRVITDDETWAYEYDVETKVCLS